MSFFPPRRNREKYIEIVFHKYLQGALRNTFLFSAGEHPYPASPQPLTPWIITSQETKQQENPSWNNDHLVLQIALTYAMMKIAFDFCFIGPVEMDYIVHKNLLMIILWLPYFSSKDCAENEKRRITKSTAIPLSIEIACDLWPCQKFRETWAGLGDIMMKLMVMMMMIVMVMMMVVTDDDQDYDTSGGLALWIWWKHPMLDGTPRAVNIPEERPTWNQI